MKLIPLIILQLLPFAVSAQILTGTVMGHDGVLEGASVIALAEGNKTLAFSITDDNGRYELVIATGKTVESLNISYMGYKKKTILMSEVKNGMTITLEDGDFKLKEVKVKADRIVQHQDTITYSVAGFKQEQDRSIADVISKMPGMEVKDNGQIFYQGKPIDKFYIEGLDLMGNQYGVASSNLSANKVQDVQVLENHQPVKSLRGISFSDQAAVNIVLKDEAKVVWNGVADLGTGYGDDFLYDNRLLAMRFNKKFQTLMMYKNNNSGKNIAQEVIDLVTLLNGHSRSEEGLLHMMQAGNASLSSKRYTFNNSHLLAGNWLWKTGKDSDFRLQGNGFIDKENMRDYTSSTYITLADLPVVTEEQIVTNHRSEWKGEASYQMNGNNTFVRDNIKGYADFNDSKGLMLLQDQRIDMLIKPHKRYVTNDFELSHTNAQKNVYDFKSYLSYNYLPGQVLTINNQTEHLNLRFFSTQNSLRFRKRLAKHYLNNQIGADYDSQNIGVAMGNEKEADNTYRLSQLYWTPSMSFNFADHKVEGSVKVCYAHQSYRESSSDHILLDPSLRWNWKATSLSDFSARLSYSNSPLMGKAIYDTPIFTGYRTQRSGRGETDITHTLSVTASYKYTNPISGTFFNIAPIYKRSMGNILYKTVLNSDIYTMEASEQESTTTTRGVSSRYSKSFGWAKTVLDLSASYMMTDYGLLAMDKVNKGRMHSSVLSFNYSLRPIRVLSLEGKSSAIISKQENRSLKNMSSGSITDWNHSLDLHVFPKKGWMISVKNELFDSSERSIDVNYFCDLSLSYKSKSWEIAFDGNNILGTSEFERRILGNTIETYSVTRLRPREFIVKVCFGN